MALATLLVGVLYIATLVRDLPFRSAVVFGPGLAIFIAIMTLLGTWRVQNAEAMEIAVTCLLGAFVVVTGGHVLRSISGRTIPVSEETRSKYMQHPERYQLAAVILGFGVALPLELGLGLI